MTSHEQKQDICSFYIRGKCKFGDKCFKYHSDTSRIKFLETENRKIKQKIKRKNKRNIEKTI